MAETPEVKTCPYCHAAYIETGEGCCPDCFKDARKFELRAKAYIRDHPSATIREVSVAAEVPMKILKAMIENEQLIMTGGADTHPCKSCGKPILEGQFCPVCRSEMLQDLSRAKESIERHRDEDIPERKHLTKEDFGGSHRFKSILEERRRN